MLRLVPAVVSCWCCCWLLLLLVGVVVGVVAGGVVTVFFIPGWQVSVRKMWKSSSKEH